MTTLTPAAADLLAAIAIIDETMRVARGNRNERLVAQRARARRIRRDCRTALAAIKAAK